MAGGDIMIAAIDSYLALRHATGYAMSNDEYYLRSFAKFATSRQEQCVRTVTAIDWASQAATVAQRHARLRAVCIFTRYAHQEDSRHETPPENYFGYTKIRRLPHIYSPAEIDRLILAAKQLPPRGGLRPHTYATLISLLAVTGMRVSEALNLLISDVTPEGLLIRKTKFQKTRLVPLHETTLAGLQAYLEQRHRMYPWGDHVFVGHSGQALRYTVVYPVFGQLQKVANLPSSGRRLRIHELRHTFAVRALESCPAGRSRIGQHMLALTTYLGHTTVDSTYWYLESTPELMTGIAVAGEALLSGVGS